jgi:hypothetical protein
MSYSKQVDKPPENIPPFLPHNLFQIYFKTIFVSTQSGKFPNKTVFLVFSNPAVHTGLPVLHFPRSCGMTATNKESNKTLLSACTVCAWVC